MTKRQPQRTGPGLLAKLLFVVALIVPVAAGLFRVWVNQDAIQIGYELSREAKRRQRLQAASQALEVELAAERSPARLKRLATRLGLKPPPPERIFGAGAQGGQNHGP